METSLVPIFEKLLYIVKNKKNKKNMNYTFPYQFFFVENKENTKLKNQ